MLKKALKVLQVNSTGKTGGAARIAWTLHQACRSKGLTPWMAVGEKDDPDPDIREIPVISKVSPLGKPFLKGAEYAKRHKWRIGHHVVSSWLKYAAEPGRYLKHYMGREDFDYPGTWKLLDLFSEPPDIVHLHNLHIKYFDLEYLPTLSSRRPTIITLHDTWLISGHCAYSLDCERWKTGCGHCPYLGIYPPTPRDSTAFNWQRKRDIYSRSKLYAAAPSQWALDQVSASMLAPGIVKKKVIHNGVDLSVFKPANKAWARQQLNIPPDTFVLLFVSSNIGTNPFKDFDTIRKAILDVEQKMGAGKILFIAVGSDNMKRTGSEYGSMQIRFVPFTADLGRVACYYQASDVYLHAAHADTFPNVILEALACGTPVVATAVGGIPEQITDGETGFLIPPHDHMAMADRVAQLLRDPELCQKMGVNSFKYARRHFGSDRMVDEYLDFYQSALDDWQQPKIKDA